jgi:diguanylate cyclase (GGDEF)-like protein
MMRVTRWIEGADEMGWKSRLDRLLPGQLSSRTLTAKPAVATARVMATTTGLFYLGGGALVFVTLPAIARDHGHTGIIAAIATGAALMGTIVFVRGRLLPEPAFHGLIALGTVLIAVVTSLSGGGPASLQFGPMFAFVAVDCFFFFAWPTALGHLAFLIGCSLTAFRVAGLPLGNVVIQLASAALVGFVVGWLARAASTAELDVLTGLVNRRGFDKALRTAVDDAERTGAPLSLAVLDFDRFKLVNDRGGHDHGDRLLQAAAREWATRLRPGQTLARVGGDEFVVIMPGCPANRAAAVADQLRNAVSALTSCSAGVAEWQPHDSQSMLIARADTSLYDAKSRGRNQTVQYGLDYRGDAAEMLAALSVGEFQVWHQPIVDLRCGTVVGTEALIRWAHPVRGLVAPSDFIPLAERTGAIHGLGAWVLHTACLQAADVCGVAGGRSLSVNASGSELRSPDYVGTVREALRQSGVLAGNLVIEVTESTLDADQPAVIDTLRRIRDMGVLTAIDDFGTGYSSLSRLDRLPVDILKIDRTFVAAMPDDGGPIMQALIGLAHGLNLITVAEGVETQRQADILRRLGCDKAQGFLFGRPEYVPAPRSPRNMGDDHPPVTIASSVDRTSLLPSGHR